jgi:hypothetical protein
MAKFSEKLKKMGGFLGEGGENIDSGFRRE